MNFNKLFGRFLALIGISILSSVLVLGQSTEGVHEGVIRLKVKPELVAGGNDLTITKSQGIALTGVPSLDRLCKQYSAMSITRVFSYSEKLEARHAKHGLHLWYELKFSSPENAAKVASAYSSLSEVSYAEPLYTTKLITGEFKAVGPVATTLDAMPFNDPYLNKQWHYHNTGDFDGLVGADINLFEAWKITAGTPNVVVSVHDEGVDYTHEDLAANMWKNMAEFNGAPGVDDDHNGFVDDIYGYNFADHNGQIAKMEHGTHVSGTIAAVNNNGKGVSGIAGGTGHGDGARIMSCQILGGSGSNIPASYIYAADNGALISQNSWGYTTTGNYEQATLDAIDYFIAEAGNFPGSPMKGGVVIFASGNNNADEPDYPGYYSNVIAVSSLGPQSTKAWYSNFGEWVEIASYGGDDTYHSQNQVLSTIPNNQYAFMQGTSMATPHVSGIAALILSKHGGANFTNANLVTHLLTGVREVNSFNPDYSGLLGVGISDAALALATDNGTGPVKINDLSLAGISQDFASLHWTVPSDPDDGNPTQFKIYYNTDSITNTNLSSAYELTLLNKSAAGAAIDFEIDNLQSTTKYYFLVVAFDRWGNKSVVSNEVSGTTNEGPSAALNPDHLDLSLDINVSTTTSGDFEILNQGAGLLKWTAEFRHKNLVLPFNTSKLHYPVLSAQPESLNINLGKQRIPATVKGVPIDNPDFTSSMMDYYDPYGPTYVIGDQDLALTNSEATRFVVSQDGGFNLTQIQVLLASDDKRGPMIMEIYLGPTLKSAMLTYAQEVTSYMKDPYWHYVYLDENIYLEKGTTFWIVFHAPAGNKYPLGMGAEREESSSDNCFFSTNLGKSWIPLADAIDDDRWVYTVTLVSDQPSMGNYMTISPSEGQVLSGESTAATVNVDGSALRNGSYSADIVISGNDKSNKLLKLPVNLEVTNHKHDLKVNEINEFGGVFVGTEKSIEVPVSNIGYGDFSEVSVSISDPQFEVVDNAPWKIASRMVETIKFKYKPTAAGAANGTVTLTDVNGASYSFYLNGVGAQPPVINVAPPQVTINNLTLGNDFTTTVAIQNTGQYPLKYAFTKFADDNALSELGKGFNKFGYSYSANLGGTGVPAYSYTTISTETNVLDYFVRNNFYEVDLGFDFPFYGQSFSKIYITKFGAVTFANEGYMDPGSPPIGNQASPAGSITASWNQFDPKSGGGIYFKHQAGKLIVEYKDVVMNMPFTPKAPATFQIILYDNGNVDMVYEDISQWDPFLLTYWVLGLGSPTHQDEYTISDVMAPLALTSKSIVRIYSPGWNTLKSVSSVSGIVPVGGSKSVDMTFSTADLREGSFTEMVGLISNDPIHNPAHAQVDFNITTGGTVNVSLSRDTIDYGTVFRTAVEKERIVIQNAGTKDIIITQLSATGTTFTLDKTAPLTIKSHQSAYVTATMKTTTIGTFSSVLTIKTNKGQTFTVPVKGKVVAQPVIAVNVASISKTLSAGDSTSVAFKVTNSGGSPLEIVTQGNDWLYLPADTIGTEKTYAYMLSSDAGGPVYNWVDILATGTRIDSLDVMIPGHFWRGLKLPFSFNYYGKNYDSVYVGQTGLVTFTGNQDESFFPPVVDLPQTDGPNNFIAPMWIPAYPDYFTDSRSGAYYQAFADKFVVTYFNYLNGFFMGNPISFQVILYNNGNIKFQYILPDFEQTTILGTVAIENQDGSDGVQIARHENLVTNKMAIILSPASKRTIPALGSLNLKAMVDARYLYKGTYTGNLVIRNNTPANPKLQIPATLNVTGLPALTWPDSIAFGEVMPYLEEDEYGILSDKLYYQYFSLVNTGKDVALLNSFMLKNASPELTVETQVEDIWFGGLYWTDVNSLSDPITIAPDNRATLRVKLLPQGPGHVLADTLLITDNLPDSQFFIPVNATVVMPPVLALSPTELTVQADTVGHQETKAFVIDNTNGASTLNYSLSLEYLRSKPEPTSVKPVKPKPSNTTARTSQHVNAVLLASPDVGKLNPQAKSMGIQTTALNDYHRLLQYDTLSHSTSQLGFNGASPIWCATQFKAPDNGYTLSHVITWYAPGAWLSTDIEVEVRGGSDDITKAAVLWTQEFNFTVGDPDTHGKYLEIALDEPQSFYPNEKFFVIVKYPLGPTYPQGTALLTNNLESTFYYSSGDDTWQDLTTTGFPSYGWMIKAAEKTEMPVGWAIIESSLTGSVAAGGQQSVDVTFKSRLAKDADNYAKVNVASNDPYNKVASVLLLLHQNQAPEFAESAAIHLAVAENDTLRHSIIASDPEGDEFHYSLASPYSKVTLTESGGQALLIFTTNFDMEGEYEFVVKAEDAFHNISTQTVAVSVSHVNRAPVLLKQIDARNYYKHADAERIDLMEYFKDLDGDALDFSVVSTDNSVAAVFVSGSQIMIAPDNVGEDSVTVAVTDSEGASTRTSFAVHVSAVAGVENHQADFNVMAYPNPTTEKVFLHFTGELDPYFSVKVMNTLGMPLVDRKEGSAGNQDIEIDLAMMPKGVYIIEISDSSGKRIRRVVKN